MFGQRDTDAVEAEKFLRHKVRKLIVEEHGEDFTADYMFDAKSL